MLTTRGWWFLFIVLILFALGLFGSHPVLALLALVLLLWFLAEWFLFSIRSRITVRNVTAQRILGEGGDRTPPLTVGRSFAVQVQVQLRGWLSLPHVALADWIPMGAEMLDGSARVSGPLRTGTPLQFRYTLRPRGVGKLRFHGVRLQLADLQGFFFHAAFLPDVLACRVLPSPVNAEGQPATSKQHNLLPPPGIHRHRRPGSGSELLNLRDYRPGDPPKTIAWKVSARRDRLITKEFESEVPVRCTLVVDASHSVRLGPVGQNSLERLIEIAAAAAQANAGNRDLTGLCLFDEDGVQIVRPARGGRHLARLVNHLVDAADLAPTTGKASADELMMLAYPLAQEVYPHLLHREVNHVPFWMAWLWPLPAESGRPASFFRHVYRILFVVIAILFLATSVLLSYVGMDLSREALPASWRPSPLLVDLSVLAGAVMIIPLLRIIYRALPLLFAFRRRRRARWRKQLAALLAARYGMGAVGVGRLLEDDEEFSLALQRFLGEHHVPYTLPLYDSAGRYLFACPGKVEVLSRALLQAVGKGHDNELFVLMVDLLELPDHLAALLRAVRVALARHHQVVVICPWPPGLAFPEREKSTSRSGDTFRASLSQLLKRAMTLRLQKAFEHMRHEFARLGVPVVWAEGREPVRLILERMERLRGLGRRR